jgi:hypothetical protein
MGGTYGNEEHYYGLKKLFYLVYKERKFSSAKTQLTSYTEKAECKSKYIKLVTICSVLFVQRLLTADTLPSFHSSIHR